MVTIKPSVWGMALIPVIVNCFFQAPTRQGLAVAPPGAETVLT
jgi:hypothetical protein